MAETPFRKHRSIWCEVCRKLYDVFAHGRVCPRCHTEGEYGSDLPPENPAVLAKPCETYCKLCGAYLERGAEFCKSCYAETNPPTAVHDERFSPARKS